MSQSFLVDQVGLVVVLVRAVLVVVLVRAVLAGHLVRSILIGRSVLAVLIYLVDYQTVRIALVGCYFVFVGQVSYCYFQLELIDRSTNLVGLLVVNFDLVVDLAVVVGCFGYSFGFAGCFD